MLKTCWKSRFVENILKSYWKHVENEKNVENKSILKTY